MNFNEANGSIKLNFLILVKTNQMLIKVYLFYAAWQSWGKWSSCSVTCGTGVFTRTRKCLNGNVGDPGCIESATETSACNLPTCFSQGMVAQQVAMPVLQLKIC